ncbi:GIY-YIG nuclease family protein [Streptomyces sp. NPDC018055]|uniref:GIY-YIG nuclease family protein n=1 Tax=Streptomyces sp. NPDC018055 TaxID=3365038 RepID=UPI0037AC8489
MPSSIYLIGTPGISTVKIGRTVNLSARLAKIQNMCPVPLQILFSAPGGPACEAALHAAFADKRSHGEWFDLEEDPVAAVKSVLLDLPEEIYGDVISPTETRPYRMPALSDYVSFEDAALALLATGLASHATGDTLRYIARSKASWPIGEGRQHAYGKAGNARTVQLGPVLEFFRENPRLGVRGPDKKPRAKWTRRPNGAS